MNFPTEITINEVGPRDALQNEAQMVPTEAKIKWINLLSETGINEQKVINAALYIENYVKKIIESPNKNILK